jgi:hypothetical protein
MSSLETFYWFSWISWNVYIFSISAWHGAVLRHQPLHPNSWKEVEKAGEEVPGGTVSKHTAIQHLCFASLFQPFQLFQLNLKALCGYHWYHWLTSSICSCQMPFVLTLDTSNKKPRISRGWSPLKGHKVQIENSSAPGSCTPSPCTHRQYPSSGGVWWPFALCFVG